MLRAVNTAVLTSIFALGFTGILSAAHKSPVQARDYGYQQGYSDGYHHGVSDRDHNNKFKADVKNADAGYEKSMGDKEEYKNGYRSGFLAGYDDGFSNRAGRFSEVYGPYNQADRSQGSADRYEGRSSSHIASDLGYRDGLAAGQADYVHHLDPRPEDQRDYREGDHGYRSSYGDRILYQQQYRDAFEQGYRDAYSGRR